MYKNQRDSCVLLYNLAQIKLDSLGSKHLAVIQQLTELSSQINTLKNELAEIIKEKSEFNDILAKAKKLIADQIIMIEKLETEVKRLTPPKSKSQ
jgi:chromosome segregation ATPase